MQKFADLPTVPRYDYHSPNSDEALGDEARLLNELRATDAFARLNGIKFLGGIDYLLIRSPNGHAARYTRYQHSVGVARLATSYGREAELPYGQRMLIAVAALLHDLGHAPLSHSLESLFAERFGLEHHRATMEIIKGDSPLGREIFMILSANGIDIEELLFILSGEDRRFGGFFSGPLTFDTIEGVLRTRSYQKRPRAGITPELVVSAAVRRNGEIDRQIVDQFWHSKASMYKSVIQSQHGLMADFICQYFMQRNLKLFNRSSFFWSEREAFKAMPGLLGLLISKSFLSEAAAMLSESLDYMARKYFVNDASDFSERLDTERYRSQKSKEEFFPRA